MTDNLSSFLEFPQQNPETARTTQKQRPTTKGEDLAITVSAFSTNPSEQSHYMMENNFLKGAYATEIEAKVKQAMELRQIKIERDQALKMLEEANLRISLILAEQALATKKSEKAKADQNERVKMLLVQKSELVEVVEFRERLFVIGVPEKVKPITERILARRQKDKKKALTFSLIEEKLHKAEQFRKELGNNFMRSQNGNKKIIENRVKAIKRYADQTLKFTDARQKMAKIKEGKLVKAANHRALMFKKNDKLATLMSKARESKNALEKSKTEKLEKMGSEWTKKISKSSFLTNGYPNKRAIELYRPASNKKILEIPDSKTMFKNYMELRKEFLAELKVKQATYRSELMS